MFLRAKNTCPGPFVEQVILLRTAAPFYEIIAEGHVL
jgi:hypothetical protein